MNITSIKDPLVLQARELQKRSERFAQRKCLLFGQEQVEWAVQAGVSLDCVMHQPGS